MREIEFAGTLDTNASYAFTGCKNVKKITILEPTPNLTSYCFNGNVTAEEIHLAGSLMALSHQQLVIKYLSLFQRQKY